MKFRGWPLLACVLGLACGPVGATDTTGDGTTTDTGAVVPTTGAVIPSTGAATTDTPTAGVDECPSDTIVIPLVTVRTMLVLERSTSMLTLWDHDRDDLDDDGVLDGDTAPATAKVTRWSSVHRSLVPAISKSAADYGYGVLTFPRPGAAAPPGDSACDVDPDPQLAPGDHTPGELQAALPPEDALDLGGASPTAAALDAAVAALGPNDGAIRVLLYVGDGAPNCAAGAAGDARFEMLDQEVAAIVGAAEADDIRFLWLGVDAADVQTPAVVDGEPDGVAPDALFSGVDSFVLNAHSEDEMAMALGGWFDTPEGGSCSVQFDHAAQWPIDRVEYGGAPLVQVVECATEHGWHLIDGGTIELCGDACTAFLDDPTKLEVLYSACPGA